MVSYGSCQRTGENGSGKRGRSLKGKETVSRLSPEAGKQRRQHRAGLLKETAEKDKKVVDRKEETC